MARIGFNEKYVFTELEKVGNALAIPVNLYLLGGAAMIRYGVKTATKDIDILLSTWNGSRHDMICEIDLHDKLDKLKTSFGLETPIAERISKRLHEQMELWFEDRIIRELTINSMTIVEMIDIFGCDEKTLLVSLTRLKRSGKIEQINGRYEVKCG